MPERIVLSPLVTPVKQITTVVGRILKAVGLDMLVNKYLNNYLKCVHYVK
ncbi:hypothetical protein SAMN04488524_3190 [Pedobacter africanus]|uniref:Uncharacterized protein n=1 Tax=Pedobacter africanus TaxID=151894 RepID=A0A1W2CRC1_9SPHI|nr:hypothetical protein SAMN04488524_3190 [Pedobacter africanus]